MNSFPQIPRRIVTGNKQGRSVIVEDRQVANISEHIPGLIIADIWATNSTLATLNREAVVSNEAFPLTPSQGTYGNLKIGFRTVQLLGNAITFSITQNPARILGFQFTNFI